MSVEVSLDYAETTDELRQWLNDHSLPCWGTRNDLIVDRVKHELLLNRRVAFRKELMTTQNGLHPAMLEGKRITEWSYWSEAYQVRLIFESLEMVIFHCGEVPKVYIERGLSDALLTLTTWKDGNLVTKAPEGWSLMVVRGELALQTSKVAGRKVGEYFERAWCEEHVVIGLQLHGMDRVEYIFAHNDREIDIMSAYGSMTMGPLIPAATVLGLPDQQYPDPGRWGQVSGIGHASETGEAAITGDAGEIEEAAVSEVAGKT